MLVEIIPNWHPIFVHFTVALLSTAAGLFLLGAISGEREWGKSVLKAAYINLWLGTLVTVATIVAGVYAYNTVNHDTVSHMAMTDHRNWAFVTTLLFVLIALWSFKNFNKAKVSVAFLIILFVTTGLLIVTAFKGGELVFRYGLGVMSMPVENGKHHDHHGNDKKQKKSQAIKRNGHQHHDHTH